MSKMSDIHTEICELLADGLDPIEVAGILNVPVSWVLEVTGPLEFFDDLYVDEGDQE